MVSVPSSNLDSMPATVGLCLSDSLLADLEDGYGLSHYLFLDVQILNTRK